MTRRNLRAISTMMAALILIAIVVFAGMMLWFMTAGFFKGGGKAAITVSGTGIGSADGTKATLNLVIQNTGDGAARIAGIYVVGETSAAVVKGITPLGIRILSGTTVPTNVPTSMPATSYVDLDAKSSKAISIQITGSGLFAGSQVRVYVVYYDLGSGQSAVADAVVTLR